MNRHTLPRALFTALVAGATAAQPAVALPPLRAELVDELTLSQVSGKYVGSNMLVGLRVDVTSTLHTPQQGSASATASLSIHRVGTPPPTGARRTVRSSASPAAPATAPRSTSARPTRCRLAGPSTASSRPA